MIRAAAAIALVLVLAAPAAADFLYGITQTDLVVIDPSDPSIVTTIGPHGLTGDPAYLTYDPISGRLFGQRTTLIAPDLRDYDLVEYDVACGSGSVVRNLGDFDTAGAFEVWEYVEAEGSLVVSRGMRPDLLTTTFETLDPATGTLTSLGFDVGFDNDFGVYDDVRDLFYVWDPNGTGLFQTIDLSSGAVTNLAASGAMDRDGAFSETDGGIFVYELTSDTLVNLQTTDGLAPITRVPVGVVAGDEILGLAFAPVAPAAICGCAPAKGCIPAGKASLSIKEKKPGSEKLKLAMKKLEMPTVATDFGDPVTGTSRYGVCIYDDALQLVTELDVDRAGDTCGTKPCWKAKGDKGFAYKDPETAASGVKKITAASGDAGKGKVQAQAGNKEKKGQTAMPTGIASDLAGAGFAAVQVLVSDGVCFEAGFADVKKADGLQFKAKGAGGLAN